MSDSVERLLIRIDATSEQLRRELKVADDSVGSFQRKIDKSLAKIKRSITQVEYSFGGLKSAAAGLGAALAIREIIQASDSMAKYRGQLGLVTSSQEELNETYAKALKLANETGQSTESTVNLYARLARSTEELNLSQTQLFDITKAINQSFVVSGASAQEASSAILQLSQGLAAGALRGEELNSVMENSPRLARALADGLGVTIGQLREMGKEGKLTADAVTGALLKTADSINTEFQQMPMTIGRVWQTLSNDINDALGQVDASPLIASVEELRAVISDPAFRENITILSQALIDLTASSASALSGLVDLTKFVGEEMARRIGGIANDDLPALTLALESARRELEFYEEGGHGAEKWMEELRVKIASLEGQIETATSFQKDLVVSTNAVAESTENASGAMSGAVKVAASYTKTQKELAKISKNIASAQKKTASQHEKNTKSLEDSYEALDDMVRAGEQYIEQQEFEIKLLGMTAREQAIANAERSAGTRITEAHAEAIRKNAAALYDIELASEQAAKATEQMEQAWESSRNTLSDFFFEFARDGKNAFDTLVDGFKAMLAKMIAEAAANQIILGIGAAAGGLGFAGAANAAASSVAANAGAGFLPSLGTSAAGYFMQNSSLFTNQGLQFAVPGDGGAALGPQFSPSGALYTAGAGLVGGFAGNAVFGGGGYSNIGSTVGGLAGSLYGPLGAGIGSFLGSGLGSLFGGKNNGDNKGRADINLGTGTASVYGVGKSFDQANVDAMEAIVPVLQNIAAALGGSDAILNVSAGNKSGLSLNGQKFGKDEAGFIAAAIDAMVDGATGLSKTLKKLIQGFDGTSEELIAFATSMVSVTELIKDNPVDRAVREFSDAQAIAGRTLMQTYKGQLDALNDLIYGFDGSADGAVTLNNALSINKQLAYDMAMALEAIGASTKSVVKDQVDYFNESVRTPDESLRYMEGQLRFIDAILPKLTDPDQILASRDKALELNKAIFDAGPADLQRANVQTYIDMANTIGEKTATALENATAGLQTSQQDLNQQIGAMLEVAASGFQAPADTMMSAAQMMYLAVQNLINNGGSQYNQVVA